MIDRVRTLDLRAVLAVGFSLTAAFLWVTTGDVPPTLLVVTSLCVGVVIGYLGAEPKPARLEAVDAPFIPDVVAR